jgi:uncharacterized protein YifE (UPF0438 family)
MNPSSDHAAYLARHDFVVPPGDFTQAESQTLAKYGRWMEALAAGTIAPTTPTQEHFVRAARGEVEPSTDFERAWAKVQAERAVADGMVRAFQALRGAKAHAALLEAEYLAARQEVLATIREQLDAVDMAFAEQIQAAADAAAAAEKEVRELVLKLRRSVGLAGVKVAYHPGRVTWDDEKLAAYAQAHPELLEFRKVGKPFVSLRISGNSPADNGAVSEPGEVVPPAAGGEGE